MLAENLVLAANTSIAHKTQSFGFAMLYCNLQVETLEILRSSNAENALISNNLSR